MRILAKTDMELDRYTLVRVTDKAVRATINDLIGKKEYLMAILETLSNGEPIEEIFGHEKTRVEAKLILTEKSAHWDLTA